jgi:quercetin dioxygenase-like cupin family protein
MRSRSGGHEASEGAVGMAGQPYLAVHDGPTSVLADAGRTGGRLSLVVHDLAAGDTGPWQRVAEVDVGYLVLAGRLEVRLPDRCWVVDPLALVSCPRGTSHRVTALTAARVAVLATPGDIEPFLVHGAALAAADPALFLALAQEHRVEVLPDLLPWNPIGKDES